MKGFRGTDPFGRHPPDSKNPKAPFCLILFAAERSFSGVVAACIVCRTLLSQCLQFRLQAAAVTETVGNLFGEDSPDVVL